MCKQLGAFLTWRENPSPALNASQACIYLPCHLPSMSLVCGTRPFPKELTARAVWSRGRRAFNQFTDQKPDQFDAWFTQAGTGVPGGGTLAMANPQPPAQALPPPPWAESCQLELDESWSSSTRSSTAWNPENAGKKKKKTTLFSLQNMLPETMCTRAVSGWNQLSPPKPSCSSSLGSGLRFPLYLASLNFWGRANNSDFYQEMTRIHR